MLLKDSHTQCLPFLGEGHVADRCAIGKLFSKRMQPAREYPLKMFLLEKSKSSFWPWLTWRWDHSDVSTRSEAVAFAGWWFDSGDRGRKKCKVHCFQWLAYVWLCSTPLKRATAAPPGSKNSLVLKASQPGCNPAHKVLPPRGGSQVLIQIGSPETSRQRKGFWINSPSLNRLRAFFLIQQTDRTFCPRQTPILAEELEGLDLRGPIRPTGNLR